MFRGGVRFSWVGGVDACKCWCSTCPQGSRGSRCDSRCGFFTAAVHCGRVTCFTLSSLQPAVLSSGPLFSASIVSPLAMVSPDVHSCVALSSPLNLNAQQQSPGLGGDHFHCVGGATGADRQPRCSDFVSLFSLHSQCPAGAPFCRC